MSVTQAMLDAMDAAIASGILETRTQEGQVVKYNTTADLLRARAHLAQQLAAQASVPAPTYVHPEFTRGV